MKLDREQVVNGLRCCAGDIILCQKCAYSKNGYSKCKEEAAKEALALIRELTEENEKYRIINHLLEEDRRADDSTDPT